MALTDTDIRNLKPASKQYKVTDGRGMYLLVTPSGGKCWRLKYYYGGKEKLLALGIYPEVSLKEARDKRDQARQQIADGKDPCQLKKQEKLKQKICADKPMDDRQNNCIELLMLYNKQRNTLNDIIKVHQRLLKEETNELNIINHLIEIEKLTVEMLAADDKMFSIDQYLKNTGISSREEFITRLRLITKIL
jgi:hypothetical protein